MEGLDEQTYLLGSRHVPQLLRHQLLCHLTANYLMSDEDNEDNQRRNQHSLNHSNLPAPSVERFYGAVLFVDISGFTALSLKLDVETLKNHINDYFSKMLAVIEKWNGDVIKFAGDALYIVWPVQLSELQTTKTSTIQGSFSNPRFLEAARATVNKAINCALEINFCCCHHKIIIGENVDRGKQRWTKLFNALPVLLASSNTRNKDSTESLRLPVTEKQSTESETVYLNVHSGVGFGLLAGVDIGANDRWEFFLLGEPLAQSANAEAQAKTGDVVVSDIVHSLYHECTEGLTCSCSLLNDKFYRVNNSHSADAEPENQKHSSPVKLRKVNSLLLRSKSKNKLETYYFLNLDDESKVKDFKQNDELRDEVQILLSKLYPTFQSFLLQFIKDYHIDITKHNFIDAKEDDTDLEEEDTNDETLVRLAVGKSRNTSDHVGLNTAVAHVEVLSDENKPRIDPSKVNMTDQPAQGNALKEINARSKDIQTKKLVLKFIDQKLKPAFVNWLLKCLVDDIQRHIHEAPRRRHEYAQLERTSVVTDFLKSCFFFHGNLSPILNRLPSSRFPLRGNGEQQRNNRNSAAPVVPSSAVQSNFKLQLSRAKSFVNDVGLSAELRTVTVMFINILGLNAELNVLRPGEGEGEVVDTTMIEKSHETVQHVGYSAFNFIHRSPSEEKSDLQLLFQLQNCMEAICNALFENGGQLRQFIVDDKGTVCIGTFGLRGSMAVDNAASAIECARTIVMKLNQINLQASIGITTGKGYCGIVGSKFRHEYAVMGPSTNLSARLMGKAGINQILCDTETRNRDRTHRFTALGAIKAKGYTDLVQTFSPIFDDLSISGGASNQVGRKSSFDSVMIRKMINQAPRDKTSSRSVASLFKDKELSANRVGGGDPQYGFASTVLKELTNTTLLLQKRHEMDENSVGKDQSENEIAAVSKLYGRSSEIQEITQFLILPFCAGNDLITAAANISAEKQSRKFDVMLPSRLMAVNGKEGIGKSSLVTAIAMKLSMMSHLDPSCNATVIKNRTSTVSFSSPFQSIKSIVQEMLIKYCQLLSTEPVQPVDVIRMDSQPLQTRVRRVSWRTGGLRSSGTRDSGFGIRNARHSNGQLNTVEWQIKCGVQSILPHLSPDHQILLPLLTSFKIVSRLQDNEYVSLLTGKTKVVGALDLICALFDVYCKVTGQVLLVVCEKLHLFDHWSLACLNQVWRNSKGVMILCTYSETLKDSKVFATLPAGHHSNGASVVDAAPSLDTEFNMGDTLLVPSATNVPRRSSALRMQKETGFDEEVFFHQYSEDENRFKVLQLRMLDKASIQAIAHDTIASALNLAESNGPSKENMFRLIVDKVYEMSGGNPLYATTIMNSVNFTEIAKVLDDESLGDQRTAHFEQLLSSATNRLGEVICYRFDQLDTLTQVILKSAAVVCANHQDKFTLDTLFFLMYHEARDEESSSKDGGYAAISSEYDIINCLRSLVQNEEFIQIVETENDAEESSPISESPIPFDDSKQEEEVKEIGDYDELKIGNQIMMKKTFAFRVILEQMTIYDLLVDEQKEKIHESVAIYYHQKNSMTNARNVENTLEEAFHWRNAKVYPYALICCYQAAVFYQQQGDYENMKLQLQVAEELHSTMRVANGLLPPSTEFMMDYLLTVYELYEQDADVTKNTAGGIKSKNANSERTIYSSSRGIASGFASCSDDNTYNGSEIDKSKYFPNITNKPLIPEEVLALSGNTANALPEAPPSPAHRSNKSSPQRNLVKIVPPTFYNEANATLLFDMCLGDGEVFAAIISSQIMIAQNYCMAFENPFLALTILEDCLMLLLLYRKHIARQLNESRTAAGNIPTINESPLQFAILLNNKLEIDENVDKEHLVALTTYLTGSFETYLSQVYTMYIWLICQSPLVLSNDERMKKAWFLCDRLLALVAQPPFLSDLFSNLSNLPVSTVNTPSPKHGVSVAMLLPQKSKRRLSQRFQSFRKLSVQFNPQPSQAVLLKTLGPSFRNLMETEQSQPAQRAPLLNTENIDRVKGKVRAIHSTCLYILLLIRDGQLSKAVKKCDRVLLSYSIRKYSKTLIELYGYDITQYTMTMLCQELLLVGEIEKCFNYFTIIFENIYHLKDYYSILLTYLPLFSVCVTLRKFSDAKKVLLLVEEYEKQTFHVQVFHPLIKMEMKYFLTMAKILWDDDDRGRADEEQQPKQKNQEVNYYHRFLRNSFAKLDIEEGLLSMSTKQRKRFDDLDKLSISYQSELERIKTEANGFISNPERSFLSGNDLNELGSEDFIFLYDNSEQYFGYFLFQQGCGIESILACVKLLQFVAQHQEQSPSSSYVPEALKIFERQYEAIIRFKSMYASQTIIETPRCNVYSDLISFSILFSLYNDLQRQLTRIGKVNIFTDISLPLKQINETKIELSSTILQQLEQLLIQSEKCSYSLPLTIFSEFLLTIPRYQTENNPTPSSNSNMNHYQQLAQQMIEKGYSDIQRNHNSSQLKGFEYLISRMIHLY